MKQLIDNRKLNIYPEINEYLSGTINKEYRYLKPETLELYKVGTGEEKFFDYVEESWVSLKCVYFPMFVPLSKK